MSDLSIPGVSSKVDTKSMIEALMDVERAKLSRKEGRPAISNHQVLEGILWVLRAGARWQYLPDGYPSVSTY